MLVINVYTMNDGWDKWVHNLANTVVSGEAVFLYENETALVEMTDKIKAICTKGGGKRIIQRLRLFLHGIDRDVGILFGEDSNRGKNDIVKSSGTAKLSPAARHALAKNPDRVRESDSVITTSKEGLSALKSIKPFLESTSVIEVHACRSGNGTKGQEFIQNLSDLLGAIVIAAEIDQTHGDEKLEGSHLVQAKPGGTPVRIENPHVLPREEQEWNYR